jgi:hypothetical protein
MAHNLSTIVMESVIVIVIVIFGVMILSKLQENQVLGSPSYETAQKGKDALSLFLDMPDIKLYLAIVSLLAVAIGGYWYWKRDSGGNV